MVFSNGRKWTLNPAAITKVRQYSVGDVVKVIDDMVKVHDLQENHGGWVDDIALVRCTMVVGGVDVFSVPRLWDSLVELLRYFQVEMCEFT